MLEIKNLHARVEGKEILKGVSLTVQKGEIHALMGPNGSGKSTLAHVLIGHPKYEVTSGSITFNGEDILSLSPDKRALLGLFLAFQYPQEIEGISLSHFLFTALRAKHPEGKQLHKFTQAFKAGLQGNLEFLGMDSGFADRFLNCGFSGGEKKRTEILQLLTLRPEIAVLDETDSGLDIDSLQIVAKALQSLRGPGFGSLVITHYQRILHYLEPDFVHVMVGGTIVKSGGRELAAELEKKGYNWLAARV